MAFIQITTRILFCCVYLFVHGYCRKVLQYRDDDDDFWGSISTPRIPSSSYGTGVASRTTGRVGAKIAAVVGGIVAGVAGISCVCFRCRKVEEKKEEENEQTVVVDHDDVCKPPIVVATPKVVPVPTAAKVQSDDDDDDDTYCYDLFDEEMSSKEKPRDAKKSLADVIADSYPPVHLAPYSTTVLPSFRVSTTSSSSSLSGDKNENVRDDKDDDDDDEEGIVLV